MPITPKYTPLRRIENKSLMQMFTKITMPPPPMPCTARLAINMLMLTLTALNSEPTQNTATAHIRMGFRPQISEIFPHTGAAAALASR